jgi:pyruvate/2-oxoacid:ferredoxin oxidoreductase beta subunit
MNQGHNACPGCASVIAIRNVLGALANALADDFADGTKPRICGVVPASCTTIFSGINLQNALKIPLIHAPFEVAGPVAEGIEAGLLAQGIEDAIILIIAGDGATYDIGLGSLLGLVERLKGVQTNIFYLCLNNQVYGNTGGQRSGATPKFAGTTTTPKGKMQFEKPITETIAINGASLAFNGSVAFLENFREMLELAVKTKYGVKFGNIQVPCTTNWKFPSDMTIEVGRLAVETGIWPLYHILDGRDLIIDYHPREFLPVEDYLKLQGRFKGLTKEQIEIIQENVCSKWDDLERKAINF